MTSLVIPTAVLMRARQEAAAFHTLTGTAVDAAELIAGRAGQLGLTPRGSVSAGGASRLMPARDRWFALTLSRADDIAAVPALLEVDAVGDDPWPEVLRWAAARDSAEVTERARLLGLPVAAVGETPATPPRTAPLGAGGGDRGLEGLLVADLSAMWAGPLCGQLLARAGATVVKVESVRRPDGARSGPSAFFDWMNAGKLSYVADFDRAGELLDLLAAADVVIESSRPAALIRRGLGPADVPARDGKVWVRITGHGAEGERADWVAFGDDAAASGGLVAGSEAAPQFCGDAIADPLTGLHAAVSIAESLRDGGGRVVDVSMSALAASYAEIVTADETTCAATPEPSAPASAPGADQDVVRRLLSGKRTEAC